MLTKPLLTTHDVADLLKMKEATVRRWIRDGELPAILIHREWRVSMKHLEEFVEARLKNGAREDIKKGEERGGRHLFWVGKTRPTRRKGEKRSSRRD
jgi:excisionase family DNA binding protein